MSKIADFVKLKSGYANFVNLKADFAKAEENAGRMAMYRPTKAHRRALERICRGLYQPNDKKFYLLSGSYGTGKSHLCLMLANMLSRSSGAPEMKAFYDTYAALDGDAGKRLRNVRKGGQYLVAICDFETGRSFEDRVLRAVFEACDRMGLDAGLQTEYGEAERVLADWESKADDDKAITNHFANFCKALETVAPGVTVDQLRAGLKDLDSEMLENFRAAFRAAQGGTDFQARAGNVIPILQQLVKSDAFKERFTGLAIFFDEFGFTLEKAEYSKDVLQGFMETVCQNLPNVVFVGCIHKSFAAYSDRFSQDDAAVMTARLTAVDLLNEGIEEIIAAIVETDKTADTWKGEVEPKLGVLNTLLPTCSTLNLFPWIEDVNRIRSRVLEDIYGVHPMALACLLRLSSEIGSDVRSTFTFFSGDVGGDEGSYKEFIEQAELCADGGKLNLYTVDRLFGFFRDQLSLKNPELRDRQRQLVNGYVASVDALRKSLQGELFDELTDDRMRVLRTVLVYQLCQIPCTLENIQFGLYALSNAEKKTVERELKNLEKAGSLFFRKQSKTYEMAVGSGEDPYDLVEQYLANSELHPADTVAELLAEGGDRRELEFLEAKQYNLAFGEDKRFKRWFVRAKDLGVGLWEKIQEEQAAAAGKEKSCYEGSIVYALCEDEADRKVAKEAVGDVPDDTIVVGVPHEAQPFTDMVLKVKACRHYLNPESTTRLNAQTESRLRDLLDNPEDGFRPELQRTLAAIAEGSNACWYGKDGKIVVDRPAQAHKPVDDLCGQLYTKHCRIKHADLNHVHDDKWRGGRNSALKQAVATLLEGDRVQIDNGNPDNHGDKRYLEKVLFKGAGALRSTGTEGHVTFFACESDPAVLSDNFPLLKALCTEMEALAPGKTLAVGDAVRRGREAPYGAGGTALVLCLAHVTRAFGERLRAYKDSTLTVELPLEAYDDLVSIVADPATKVVFELRDITAAQRKLVDGFARAVKAKALKHGESRTLADVVDLLRVWWRDKVPPVAGIETLYDASDQKRIVALRDTFGKLGDCDRFDFLLSRLPEVYSDGPVGSDLAEADAEAICKGFTADVALLEGGEIRARALVADAIAKVHGASGDVVECERVVDAWFKGLNPNQRDALRYDDCPEAQYLVKHLGGSAEFPVTLFSLVPKDFGLGELLFWTALSVDDYAAKWKEAKEAVEAAAVVVPPPVLKAGKKAKHVKDARWEIDGGGEIEVKTAKGAVSIIYTLDGVDPKKSEVVQRSDGAVVLREELSKLPQVKINARALDAQGNASDLVTAHVTNKSKEYEVVVSTGTFEFVREATFKFPEDAAGLKAVLESMLDECVKLKIVEKAKAEAIKKTVNDVL